MATLEKSRTQTSLQAVRASIGICVQTTSATAAPNKRLERIWKYESFYAPPSVPAEVASRSDHEYEDSSSPGLHTQSIGKKPRPSRDEPLLGLGFPTAQGNLKAGS